MFHGMSSFSGKDWVRLSDLGGGCTANYESSARPLRYSVNLSVFIKMVPRCALSVVMLLCGLVDLSGVIMLCGLVRNYPTYG